jgi:hypothetical protein
VTRTRPKFIITSVRDADEEPAQVAALNSDSTIGQPQQQQQNAPIAARRSATSLRLDCSSARALGQHAVRISQNQKHTLSPCPRLQLTEPSPLTPTERSSVSLRLPPAEHASLTGRSLTDLHKDLDSIFTTGTPPKSKSTPQHAYSSSSGGGGGSLKTKPDLPPLPPRPPAAGPQQPSPSSSCSSGQQQLLSRFLGPNSRVKSLSRVSLLDIPHGGGGGDLEDMYHTITGGRTNLMSASRPAIPFARITTTRRQEGSVEAPLAERDFMGEGGSYGGIGNRDNDTDSVQGLSEEVWRVSSKGQLGPSYWLFLDIVSRQDFAKGVRGAPLIPVSLLYPLLTSIYILSADCPRLRLYFYLHVYRLDITVHKVE